LAGIFPASGSPPEKYTKKSGILHLTIEILYSLLGKNPANGECTKKV